MTKRQEHVQAFHEATNDGHRPSSLSSNFHTAQLRFQSSLLVGYKIVAATVEARVAARDKPTGSALREYETYGFDSDYWDRRLNEDPGQVLHSVIVGLQMTGGDALADIIKMYRNDSTSSILFSIPGYVFVNQLHTAYIQYIIHHVFNTGMC